jgi:hypothetical protein
LYYRGALKNVNKFYYSFQQKSAFLFTFSVLPSLVQYFIVVKTSCSIQNSYGFIIIKGSCEARVAMALTTRVIGPNRHRFKTQRLLVLLHLNLTLEVQEEFYSSGVLKNVIKIYYSFQQKSVFLFTFPVLPSFG